MLCGIWHHLQPRQLIARLSKLAAHPQALEAIDGLGEGRAGGRELAAEGVETGVEAVDHRESFAVLILLRILFLASVIR